MGVQDNNRPREPRLEIERDPGHLLFRSTPQHARLKFLALLLVLAVAAGYCLLHVTTVREMPMRVTLIGAVLLYGVYRTRHPVTSQLEVTAERIVARQGVRGWVITNLPRTAVEDLVHIAPSDHQTGGLYAAGTWNRTLLLPGVTLEQATGIVDVIRASFPDTPMVRKVSGQLTAVSLIR